MTPFIFVELTALELGWGGIKWEGKNLNEVGKRLDTLEIVVRVDEKYFRPAEVSTLVGDASKARDKIGWHAKTSLEELVKEMVEEDKKIALKQLKENS